MQIAAVVDWKALGQVVIAAFVAGIGVTTVFAVAIVGVTRFTDARREGQAGIAAAYAAVAVAALAACIAAVVLGIVEMTRK